MDIINLMFAIFWLINGVLSITIIHLLRANDKMKKQIDDLDDWSYMVDEFVRMVATVVKESPDGGDNNGFKN